MILTAKAGQERVSPSADRDRLKCYSRLRASRGEVDAVGYNREVLLSLVQTGCIEGETMDGAVRMCPIDSLRSSSSIARESQVSVLRCTQKMRSAVLHPRERTSERHEHI